MKLCGCKEKCFKKGKCWGHFEGTMCEHLGEKVYNGKHVGYCFKANEVVDVYTTQTEYETLTNRGINQCDVETH